MALISSGSFFPSAPLSHPKKKLPWSQLAPTSLYHIFPFLPSLISQVASISSPFIYCYACVIWFALAPFVPVTPAAWKYPKQSAFKQPSFYFVHNFVSQQFEEGLAVQFVLGSFTVAGRCWPGLKARLGWHPGWLTHVAGCWLLSESSAGSVYWNTSSWSLQHCRLRLVMVASFPQRKCC